jgi:hypothetical protein
MDHVFFTLLSFYLISFNINLNDCRVNRTLGQFLSRPKVEFYIIFQYHFHCFPSYILLVSILCSTAK